MLINQKINIVENKLLTPIPQGIDQKGDDNIIEKKKAFSSLDFIKILSMFFISDPDKKPIKATPIKPKLK
nr:hypothetical protein [Proteus mirabilis]EKV2711009.1 hypothetical protein [Proteus mirabilis]